MSNLITKFTERLQKTLPQAFILVHGGGAMIMHHGDRVVGIPEFFVCRGFILGAEAEAPTHTPALTEDEAVEANVQAVKHYLTTIFEAMQLRENDKHTVFVMVNYDRKPDSDEIQVGLFVYRE